MANQNKNLIDTFLSENASLGRTGKCIIADTDARELTRDYYAMQFLQDTEIAELDDELLNTDESGTFDYTGITFPAGLVIYGKFNATIELVSGAVALYAANWDD